MIKKGDKIKILSENKIIVVERMYELKDGHYYIVGKDENGVQYRINSIKTSIAVLLQEDF